MPWEARGPNLYYYRKRRVDGRVVSRYVGPGILGVFAEVNDRERRCDAHDGRRAAEGQIRRWRTIDANLARFCECMEDIVAAALGRMGYHRHKGQWRRCRMKGKQEKQTMTPDEIVQAMKDAAAKACRPDATADDCRDLTQLLLDYPQQARRLCGDPAEEICFYVGLHGYKDQRSRALLLSEFEMTRRALGRDEADPLEQVLIDLLAVSRAQFKVVAHYHAVAMELGPSSRGRQAWERLLASTQRRVVQAARTLSQVRRALNCRHVRINVAAGTESVSLSAATLQEALSLAQRPIRTLPVRPEEPSSAQSAEPA